MPPHDKPVLLVEDSEDDVLIFQRGYRDAGISNPLHLVHSGDDAIAYLKGDGRFSNRGEHPFPRLVILDLKMPGKSGFDVLRWVREEPTTKDLRVVVMTGSEDVSVVQRAYELGANSFILKSMNAELVRQLRDIQNQWL